VCIGNTEGVVWRSQTNVDYFVYYFKKLFFLRRELRRDLVQTTVSVFGSVTLKDDTGVLGKTWS
jgi:hypothetical protein